ncbi:hypothetical protein [Massilia sp. Dwa41.01b]|uniref:hypothetical protein n=1 Tax=Massilia sp. Dwa41.01b TaxID=2709302 RepID=UPI001E38EB40|nr:hypothetical protein [Massilia sp. Dwa41.01b]
MALAKVDKAMTTPEGEAIVDLVGFGTANRFEGFVAPAPSISTSLQRAAPGCTDTDNNAADFTAATVVGPRRSTSPINSCGGPVQQAIVLSCPAGLQAEQGSAASAPLSARDEDSIVNSAVIESGAVPGISLDGFVAAGAIGASANATLSVAASVAPGSYPVKIRFANNDGQSASCTVPVRVAGQLSIPQIQGTGPRTAYHNTVQTTQGVVTAVVGSGFFLQDPKGDGDPASSDAIFVFGSSAGLAVGDLVRITGTVVEYTPSGASRSYTEFKDLGAVTKLGSGPAIAPANVALPDADLARFEAMLVRFTTPLTVNGNAYLAERGELTLSSGRREIPTNRYPAGSPEARALARDNAANMIVLDDGIFTTPAQIPLPGQDGTVRAGDTVTDLTGVLDFGAIGGGGAAFKVQPTVTPVFSHQRALACTPCGKRQREGRQRQRAELLHHLYQRPGCLGPHRPGLHHRQPHQRR